MENEIKTEAEAALEKKAAKKAAAPKKVKASKSTPKTKEASAKPAAKKPATAAKKATSSAAHTKSSAATAPKKTPTKVKATGKTKAAKKPSKVNAKTVVVSGPIKLAGKVIKNPVAIAELTKRQTAIQPELTRSAKEIDVRFEKASKLDGQADDHRLAAALLLADAKKKCEDVGLNFKEWANANIHQSYENVRKLVTVGQAEDPKLALTDMREANKVRNRELRERQAQAGLPAPHTKPAHAKEPASAGPFEPASSAGPVGPSDVHTAVERMKNQFLQLPVNGQLEIINFAAEEMDAEIVWKLGETTAAE